MKSSTHKMAEAITKALGPIFHANPDYKTITEAIALTVARIAQSTPEVGNEENELEVIMQIAADALNIFLNEEKKFQENIQRGIDAFTEMVSCDGEGPSCGLDTMHESIETKVGNTTDDSFNPDGPRAYL